MSIRSEKIFGPEWFLYLPFLDIATLPFWNGLQAFGTIYLLQQKVPNHPWVCANVLIKHTPAKLRAIMVYGRLCSTWNWLRFHGKSKLLLLNSSSVLRFIVHFGGVGHTPWNPWLLHSFQSFPNTSTLFSNVPITGEGLWNHETSLSQFWIQCGYEWSYVAKKNPGTGSVHIIWDSSFRS